MRKLFVFAGTLVLSGVLAFTAGAVIDPASPFLCALMNAAECAPGQACDAVSLDTVDLPVFITVDVGNKTISGTTPSGEERSVGIFHSDQVEGQLFLQGVQKRAWSITVSTVSGKMSLAASGDQEAFVIFGACTQR